MPFGLVCRPRCRGSGCRGLLHLPLQIVGLCRPLLSALRVSFDFFLSWVVLVLRFENDFPELVWLPLDGGRVPALRLNSHSTTATRTITTTITNTTTKSRVPLKGYYKGAIRVVRGGYILRDKIVYLPKV